VPEKKKIWQLKINFFNFVEKQMKTLSFLSTNGNPERRITNFIFQLAESLGYKIPHVAGLKWKLHLQYINYQQNKAVASAKFSRMLRQISLKNLSKEAEIKRREMTNSFETLGLPRYSNYRLFNMRSHEAFEKAKNSGSEY
jgi:hypothetical protein